MRKFGSSRVSDLPTGTELINMRSYRSNLTSSTLPDTLAIQAGHLPRGYMCLQCNPPPGRKRYCRRCFLQFGASHHCLIIPPPSGECTQGRSKTSSSLLQLGLGSRHSFLTGIMPTMRRQPWLAGLLTLDPQQAGCLLGGSHRAIFTVTAQCHIHWSRLNGTGPDYMEFCETG